MKTVTMSPLAKAAKSISCRPKAPEAPITTSARGANIYPAEIEAAVMAHPQVRSCVVVGLPDPEFGQRVHAIVELASGADAQMVIDGMAVFLSDQLSRYKHPESFEIVSVQPARRFRQGSPTCCATSAPRG